MRRFYARHTLCNIIKSTKDLAVLRCFPKKPLLNVSIALVFSISELLSEKKKASTFKPIFRNQPFQVDECQKLSYFFSILNLSGRHETSAYVFGIEMP